MSNELVVAPGFLTPSKFATPEAHAAVVGGSFLPRLQIVQSTSRIAKRKEDPCQMGTLVIIKGSDQVLHKLGDRVDMFVASWRPAALRLAPGSFQGFYNPNSQEFKKVQVDSTQANSGCAWGPEYLVYIPEVNEFVQFHFGNPTMRRAAAPMPQFIGKSMTCKIDLIEDKQNSWYGPTVLNCSTPLVLQISQEEFHLKLADQLQVFNNPKETELLEEAPKEQERAR